MPLKSDRSRIERILVEADQCVKCGLCLPHCPTYTLSQDENEGPRGRISLLQGLALGALEPDQRLTGHLDRCLGCRACEVACPAKVSFSELMDLGKAELSARDPNRLSEKLVALAGQRGRLRLSARLLFLYQRSGLRWMARRSGLLRALGLQRLDAMTPRLTEPLRPLKPLYAAVSDHRGRVALFTGCIGDIFDRRTIEASIRVLTWQGYDVLVPPAQTCCGALALHSGYAEEAERLAERNQAAFGQTDADTVLFLASGCGAQLVEYPPLLADAGDSAPRYQDITSFILANWRERPLSPLPGLAAVHEPCSLRNVLRAQEAAYELLHLIPELKTAPLPGNKQCCGAAGSHMLTEPELADQLREPKLKAVAELAPHYLLTSNVGCALHIAAGLREQGLSVEVLHPIELLARQLQEPH